MQSRIGIPHANETGQCLNVSPSQGLLPECPALQTLLRYQPTTMPPQQDSLNSTVYVSCVQFTFAGQQTSARSAHVEGYRAQSIVKTITADTRKTTQAIYTRVAPFVSATVVPANCALICHTDPFASNKTTKALRNGKYTRKLLTFPPPLIAIRATAC